MKKTKLILLAMLLSCAAGSQVMAQEAKKTAAEEPKKITLEMLVSKHNFPVLQNTGNPELDKLQYAEAKRKWVAANQQLYRKYNSQGAPGVKATPAQRSSSTSVIISSN